MRTTRFHPLFYVLIPLIAIGLISEIVNGGQALIVPVVLIAIVYLLYKFPPDRWFGPKVRVRKSSSIPRQRAGTRHETKPKRRPSPFKVIDGNKDRGGGDNPPPYH